jgi:hypothetical protein
VTLPGGAPSLVYRPDYKALSPAHIASRKNSFNIGGKSAVIGLYIAPLISLHPKLLQQFILRP